MDKERTEETVAKTQDSSLTGKQNAAQALKFVLFSASAGLIQAGTFTLLNELAKIETLPLYNFLNNISKHEYGPIYLFALLLSVLYNFTVNRRFTFKSATNVPIAMMKIFAYYLIFTPASVWWGNALTEKFKSFNGIEYVVLIGTMLINMVTEFLVCRFIVYRNSINTNSLAQKEQE